MVPKKEACFRKINVNLKLNITKNFVKQKLTALIFILKQY